MCRVHWQMVCCPTFKGEWADRAGGDWRRVEVCGETRDGACSHRSAQGGRGVTEEGSANPATNCHRFTASLVNSAASLTLQLSLVLTLLNHFLAAHQLFGQLFRRFEPFRI